jgi:hypothetical protein
VIFSISLIGTHGILLSLPSGIPYRVQYVHVVLTVRLRTVYCDITAITELHHTTLDKNNAFILHLQVFLSAVIIP